MGRLGKSVRGKQGLAYYAYSDLRGGLGPSPWLVSAGVNPMNVSRAISSIRDEIRLLQQELVPADELADNKGFVLGSLPLHLETNSGVSDVLLDIELYELGLDYLQKYPETINAITAEQIQAAAEKYLNPDIYALAVAGPETQVA
jgi:zinc protease